MARTESVEGSKLSAKKQRAIVASCNAAIMAKEAAYKANPLYYAWKAKGFVKGYMGWDRPMLSPRAIAKGEKAILKEVLKSGSDFAHRQELVRQYSWAIPSPEAIKWIVERTKSIVEIGAGRGYWAKLLATAGAEVFAYDTSVVKGKMGKNGWHNPRSMLAPDHLSSPESESGTLFYPVKRGGPIRVSDHPDSILMLCWPPHSSRMAAQCLKFYQGNRLIYIGEWDGCCADSKFFKQLERDWREEDSFDIPQWPCIRDHVWYLVRK